MPPDRLPGALRSELLHRRRRDDLRRELWTHFDEAGASPDAAAGTFPVDGPLFTFLLIAVVLIVGALTYFPVLSLGPYVEHLLMNAGKVF